MIEFFTSPSPELVKQYPGAGALKEKGIFKEGSASGASIKRLLLPEEWLSLRNVGLLNQHFTHPSIIGEMWAFVHKFTKNQPISVLDPGCGIGGFYHHCPHPELLNYVGVELDLVTAKMAKITGINVYQCDFLKWHYPKKFDVVIGNVPFVNGVQKYVLDGQRLRIGLHAQFIAHAVEHLKSGGLLIVLTSTNTLDSVGKGGVAFRQWVDNKCHFLGAVRLPIGSAHRCKTQVTTDLVILKRK